MISCSAGKEIKIPLPVQKKPPKTIKFTWKWKKGCIWTEDISPHNKQQHPELLQTWLLTSKGVLYLRGAAEDFTAERLRPRRRGLHLLRQQGWVPRGGTWGARTDGPTQSAVSSWQNGLRSCLTALNNNLLSCWFVAPAPGCSSHSMKSHSIKNACILNNLPHK